MKHPKPSRSAGFEESASALSPRAGKRAVNLSVSRALVEEAKELGVNLSETLEAALHTRLATARERKLRDALRPAIDAFNEDFDRNGLWSEGIRPW